ncbi:hypothetical protein PGT21_036075 [Puccinia graminis f. sp. tritici]|uniref:Uncharacterized protein n=1 Tax=Puccinia graminis f. sp. tritici TaxID=56615 RepID=A0A5B0NH17_PUCGR|nr:hypothetical protein PGTUg99_019007 [Puccinia graminis f. sp. tritici]KAA1102114.1 hypothetical protein PGT21_036075 [Puccinia graminis f. sp. tritici]
MNPSRGQRLEYESKPIFKCELKSGYQIEAQIGFDSARWSRPQAENFMIRVHGTNTKINSQQAVRAGAFKNRCPVPSPTRGSPVFRPHPRRGTNYHIWKTAHYRATSN